MAKRFKRATGIFSCSSPRCSAASVDHDSGSSFTCYEDDIWTHIAKFLDGKSLVKLAAANKWFYAVAMHDYVWKHACLRDLQVLDPGQTSCSWAKLYGSAFDGHSHSYAFREQDKHIDWMRIGAFTFDSRVAFLTKKLHDPLRIPRDTIINDTLKAAGACLLRNVKPGIWIADLQLVRCPVCQQENCEGTMQMLDARHIELFLNKDYLNGSWTYELIASHEVRKHVAEAAGGIFDLKYLSNKTTARVFDLKTWIGKPEDYQPKAIIALHAVAINTNLQPNEGLHVKYFSMKNGAAGEVVSIRISQQLV